MAGDWIKMRTDLYRDPKVSVIADGLMAHDSELSRYVNQHCQRDMTVTRNVMRNVTVGALVSVWGVMRQRGKRNGDDLVCHAVTPLVIDDIAELPGFGAAMALVGWVVQTSEGIVFPRFFDEYNVSPEEKTKSQGAERQRRYRDRKSQQSDVTNDVTRDVTDNVTVTPREEKNREESINSVANATAGQAAKLTEPADIIFGYGLSMLVNAGTPEKQARSFLGCLRKAHGDEALIDKLRECAKAKALQPLEWLAAALPPHGGRRRSKHSGFDQMDYSEGIDENGLIL